MRHAVLTGIGRDRPGIVRALTEAVAGLGCNVEESRMAVLGGEFAIIMLVSGEEASVESLRQEATVLGERSGLAMHVRLTGKKAESGDVLRYRVEALSMDHPGIVNAITASFSARGINIESLSTDTYAAPHTGTPMFALDMVVEIPAGERVSELRRRFVDVCDDLYIDASLEPV